MSVLTADSFQCYYRICCLASLLLLAACTHSDESISFARHFGMTPSSDTLLSIDTDHYYVAGNTDSILYLGKESQPLHLVAIHFYTNHIQPFTITCHALTCSPSPYGRVHILKEHFYITDRSGTCVWKGLIQDAQAYVHMMDTPPLIESVVRGDTFNVHLLIGKEGSDVEPENVLAVLTDSITSLSPSLLTKQGDGLYSSDGFLRYSKASNVLVYLYFYRNEYLVIDPRSLALLHTGHTIDTVQHAHISPVKMKEGTYSMDSPPLIVNAQARIEGETLYVHSLIRGNGEDAKRFKRDALIDTYDLKNHGYKKSFYLPVSDRKQIENFTVIEKYVFAIYKDGVERFTMVD